MLACVERPVAEAQRSLDPSIFERQVTTAADIQPCLVSGSKQPQTARHVNKLTGLLWPIPVGPKAA
jgi:hypothetical protein